MVHSIGGIGVLPANSIWNTAINQLPTHPNSAAFIAAIGGASTKLRAKVSTLAFAPPNGWGIPYNLVNNSTPTYMPTLLYAATSYPGPYPIPASPLLEEPLAGGSDLHLLCLNSDTGVLYELASAVFSGGVWSGSSGWRWNLSSNALPPDGSTAADAASMPILPGLLLYDEVLSGTISHALRCAIPNGSGNYIWPAQHADGSMAGAPPHGSRFRLQASVNISSYSAINQTILTALKIYGCFLVDQGTTAELKLYGMGDTRWNDSDLQVLNTTLTSANFEVIDESALMVSSDSMAISSGYVTYRDTIEPNLVAALSANNLLNTVSLIGPDTTNANDSWLTSASTDLANTLVGYSRHDVPSGITDISSGSRETTARNLLTSIYANDNTNKPVISTIADGALGPGGQVAGYQYGMEMADLAVQLTRAGMAGIIAYLADDDMHGTQWGMWQITADPNTLRPWFFPWSVLSNTLPAGSAIYAPAQPITNDFRVVAAQAPQGAWTFVLVNRLAGPRNVQLSVPFAPVATTTLSQYVYAEAIPLFVDGNGFPLPSGTIQAVLSRGFTVQVAGNSLVILTQQSSIQTTVFNVKRPPLQKRR